MTTALLAYLAIGIVWGIFEHSQMEGKSLKYINRIEGCLLPFLAGFVFVAALLLVFSITVAIWPISALVRLFDWVVPHD
jgi:ABC-type dipeptide/oligopeptide/nickel transport system permease component